MTPVARVCLAGPVVTNSVHAHLACTSCGYDLYGNPSRTCPECGTQFDVLRLFVQARFLRAPAAARLLAWLRRRIG